MILIFYHIFMQVSNNCKASPGPSLANCIHFSQNSDSCRFPKEQRMCLGTFSARERAAKQQFPLRELCILGPIRAFFDFWERLFFLFLRINVAKSFLEIKKIRQVGFLFPAGSFIFYFGYLDSLFSDQKGFACHLFRLLKTHDLDQCRSDICKASALS